jgi:predicted nucleic acid-binding protein
MPSAEYLLDTNVLVYATLADDPRHDIARALLFGDPAGPRPAVCVSVQNLAEMWPTLTGPRTTPPDPPEVAEAKILSIAGLPHVTLLGVDRETVRLALRLARELRVTRQRYFEVQIAAVMLQNGVRHLYSENASDFRGIDGIEATNPFL